MVQAKVESLDSGAVAQLPVPQLCALAESLYALQRKHVSQPPVGLLGLLAAAQGRLPARLLPDTPDPTARLRATVVEMCEQHLMPAFAKMKRILRLQCWPQVRRRRRGPAGRGCSVLIPRMCTLVQFCRSHLYTELVAASVKAKTSEGRQRPASLTAFLKQQRSTRDMLVLPFRGAGLAAARIARLPAEPARGAQPRAPRSSHPWPRSR
jgi:hypothetical protein